MVAMTYRSASARARVFDQALREAMSATVPDAIQPEGSPASDPAAGTPRPEGVAVDRITADPATDHASLAPDDDNRVEHGDNVTPRLGDEPGCETASSPVTTGLWPTVSRSARSAGSEAAEAQRLGRLARWQKC